jgi:hypothetical protein
MVDFSNGKFLKKLALFSMKRRMDDFCRDLARIQKILDTLPFLVLSFHKSWMISGEEPLFAFPSLILQ